MWKEPDLLSSHRGHGTGRPIIQNPLHNRSLGYPGMEQDIRVKIEARADMLLLRPLDILVRNLVEQLLGINDRKLLDELELAFNEAYTNICRHAYPSENKGYFSLYIRVGTKELEFYFEDEGLAFDPDSVAIPDLANPGEGGLGIWIIRQVMDEYDYFQDERGKNVLRLIKRFP